MTDLLREHLHDTADRAVVPPADLSTVLRRGRRLRLLRQSATAVGTVAAVAGIIAVAGLVAEARDGSSPTGKSEVGFATDGQSRRFYEHLGPFASGTTVYVGDASVDLGREISGLYPTSVGALVRTGSDYTLVNPDGDTREVISLDDRIVGTEPDSTHLAYATPRDDGRWDLVVLDVSNGQELARTTVEGHLPGGWVAPPAVIDGSHAWVRLDEGVVEFDWQSGETRMLPGTAEQVYEVAGGRYAVQGSQQWTVRTTSDGSVVATIQTARDDYAFFSPDGRYLKVWDQEAMPKEDDYQRFYLVDLDTGERIEFPAGMAAWEAQWAPDGQLTVIDERARTVSSCDPATAQCSPVDMSIVDGDIWHSGGTSED